MILRSIGDEVRNEKRGDENMNCREWVCLFATQSRLKEKKRRRGEEQKSGRKECGECTHARTHYARTREENENENEKTKKRSQKRKTKAKGKIDRRK